jgi:hypothetical protein
VLVSLVSAKGSPGVTTSALGLALLWPRPAVLVEADVAGSSSLLAGWLQGSVRHDRGLINLAFTFTQRAITAADLWEESVVARDPDVVVVPGIPSPEQVGTLVPMWPALASLASQLEQAGTDLLVDTGRLGAEGAPRPVWEASDLVLLVCGTRLPDIAAARPAARRLLSDRVPDQAQNVGLLVVDTGGAYPAREIAAALGLPLVGDLPRSKHARNLSDGGPLDRLAQTPLGRALVATAEGVERFVRTRRTFLNPAAHGAAAVDDQGAQEQADQYAGRVPAETVGRRRGRA